MRHYTEVLYKQQIKKAKAQYRTQKCGAGNRGVSFNLTFDEWITWWLSTGHYLERGHKSGQYVMSRYEDKGPYSLNNIFCQTCNENIKQGNTGKGFRKKGQRGQKGSENGMYGRTGKLNVNSIPIQTPDGVFGSISEAARFYKIRPASMRDRIDKHPEKYQRISKGTI